MGNIEDNFIPSSYLLLWQVKRSVPPNGLINALTGRTVKKIKTFIKRFDSKVVAEYGYQNIKRNGYKPLLLKIIKE